VGAPNDDDGRGNDTGSAYLFLYTGTWAEIARLHASDAVAQANDQLGASVSVSGTTIVVGAPRPMGEEGFAADVPLASAVGQRCSGGGRCLGGFWGGGVWWEGGGGGRDPGDCVMCATNGMCGADREGMPCPACGSGGMCGGGACSTAASCDAGSP